MTERHWGLSEQTRRRLMQVHLDDVTDDDLAPARGITRGLIGGIVGWIIIWAVFIAFWVES